MGDIGWSTVSTIMEGRKGRFPRTVKQKREEIVSKRIEAAVRAALNDADLAVLGSSVEDEDPDW